MTIEVLQVPFELARMVALYLERAPRRVLEIGTYEGGTLREWLRQGTPEIVVAVDLDHRKPANYRRWCKAETDLHVVTGDSHSAEVIAHIREHAPYDWIFIDGDHGDAGVRPDVHVCESVASAGGVMLLHDIVPGAGLGLTRYPPGDVVDEFERHGYRVERWVDPEPVPWAHGVGVVYL